MPNKAFKIFTSEPSAVDEFYRVILALSLSWIVAGPAMERDLRIIEGVGRGNHWRSLLRDGRRFHKSDLANFPNVRKACSNAGVHDTAQFRRM